MKRKINRKRKFNFSRKKKKTKRKRNKKQKGGMLGTIVLDGLLSQVPSALYYAGKSAVKHGLQNKKVQKFAKKKALSIGEKLIDNHLPDIMNKYSKSINIALK